tara:strand:- start:1050 stop:1709 length:660 start_codon:yes stop_codon:yes gene_type:complete
MINEKVSVIVCTFNQGKWLKKCLDSLINQKFFLKRDYEVILIDDASKDLTKTILKKYKKNKNIKVFRNKKNLGLPKSLNIGLNKSINKYIVRVDADDFVEKKFLKLSREFLQKNDKYQAVAVDYNKVDNENFLISKENCKKKEIACGVMFLKRCLDEIGHYNENFKMREGHELKKRFLLKYKIGRLPKPLYNYRQHAKNRTKNKKKLKLYDKMLKLKYN